MTGRTDRLDRPWAGVDSALAVVLRGGLEQVIEDVIAAVAAEVPAYARPEDGHVQGALREGVRVALERLMSLLGTAEAPLGPAAEVYERIGAAEYRSHRPLPAVLAAYRVGALTTWRGLSALSAVAGTDAVQTARLAEACFAYIDEISAASAAGYSAAAAADAGRREALAGQLVAAVVESAGAGVVSALSADLGWELPESLRVAVWEDVAAPPGILAARHGGLTVALLPEPPSRQARSELDRLSAAVGTAQPVGEAPVSFRHARLLHRLRQSGAIPNDAAALTEEHVPALLLMAEESLTQALIARRLAVLDGLDEQRRAVVVDTTAAWLLHGGSRAAVAEQLHIHPQTVAYRMGGIRALLGAQLADAEGRWELLLALRAEQLVRPSR